MTLFGYMGSLARYSASQSVPVAKDVTNYMLDGTKESIGLVAGEISKNLHQTQNQKSSIKYCSACHEELADEARFCDHCGVPLFKKCTKCNKENDIDAIYCQDCGAKLEV
jgi:rRNA maturation endonuclease Nob1